MTIFVGLPRHSLALIIESFIEACVHSLIEHALVEQNKKCI